MILVPFREQLLCSQRHQHFAGIITFLGGISLKHNVTTAWKGQEKGITYADARKAVESMNLIDGFLFDSSIEDEADAKIVIGAILRTVLNREISEIQVTSQKQIQAIDTRYHGIRLDARVDEEADGKVRATIYDIEMENRPADRAPLPRRLRFYDSIIDSRLLESGAGYDDLPDFVSITILSYDPFGAGDMYYEASTTLTTHPDIGYDDGITHIFLYCHGKASKSLSPSHGKRLMEVLKYIVSGEKPSIANSEVNSLEEIVSKIKKRSEVTRKYMKQWDRERVIALEARAEGKAEERDQINRLNSILIEQGRIDDLSKSATDIEYQDKLIKELLVNKIDNTETEKTEV